MAGGGTPVESIFAGVNFGLGGTMVEDSEKYAVSLGVLYAF